MSSSIAQTDRIRYAIPQDVFAAFKDDSSISVEEFPKGEIAPPPSEPPADTADVIPPSQRDD